MANESQNPSHEILPAPVHHPATHSSQQSQHPLPASIRHPKTRPHRPAKSSHVLASQHSSSPLHGTEFPKVSQTTESQTLRPSPCSASHSHHHQCRSSRSQHCPALEMQSDSPRPCLEYRLQSVTHSYLGQAVASPIETLASSPLSIGCASVPSPPGHPDGVPEHPPDQSRSSPSICISFLVLVRDRLNSARQPALPVTGLSPSRTASHPCATP